MTWRAPETGGRPERELAGKFERWATASSFPRTASVLRTIADSYGREGRHEDEQRDLNEYE